MGWKRTVGGTVAVGAVAGATSWAVMRAGQTPPRTYDLHGRTVLVTGANSGIGKHTAIALARGGARVLVGARHPQRGSLAVDEIRQASGNDAVELLILDLADLDAVRAAAREVADRVEHLDVLVNNAGLVLGRREETADGFEATIGTNHLGPFLLTHLLVSQLRAAPAARIVNVASLAHTQGILDLDDLMWERRPYVGMQVYAASKLANVLFTRELARRLQGTGVTANSLHPGTVRTGFGQEGDVGPIMAAAMAIARPFMIDEERGASTTVYVAGDPSLEGTSGRYYSRQREAQPSPTAQDDLLALGLWEASESLVDLPDDLRL